MKLAQFIALLLVFSGSTPLLAASKTVYLPFDNLRLPQIPGWSLNLDQVALRAHYVKKAPSVHANSMQKEKETVQFSRRLLSPGQQWPGTWKALVLNDLRKGHNETRGTVLPHDEYQVAYTFTENLMLVDGVHFFHQVGNLIYDFSCEKERQTGFDLKSWCAVQFGLVVWPDSIKIKTAVQKHDALREMEQFPLDQISLKGMRQRLTNELQVTPVPADRMERLAILALVESLLHPPLDTDQKKALVQDILNVANVLKQIPFSYILMEWLETQADFLSGTFTQSKAEKLAQSAQRPPFWLLSLWTEPLSSSIALNLAGRQNLQTPLTHFVLGKMLFNEKEYAQAIPHLKLAMEANSNVAMEKLARSYAATGQLRKAQLLAGNLVKKDPGNADFKLLLASLYPSQTKDTRKAQAIYAQLASSKTLPKNLKTRMYVQQAKTTDNPEERMALYSQVLAVDDSNLEALYAMGRLYLLERNNSEKSIEYFRRYLAKAPKDDPRFRELQSLVASLEKERKEKTEIPSFELQTVASQETDPVKNSLPPWPMRRLVPVPKQKAEGLVHPPR